MATAAATYTWAAHGTALKAYLGVSGSGEDANLTLWLASAAEDCDDYCQWYYYDENDELQDETPSTMPNKITLGIYTWVQTVRAWHARGDSVGVTQKRTGALAENYGGDLAAAQAAREAAAPLWEASIHNLLIAAGG